MWFVCLIASISHFIPPCGINKHSQEQFFFIIVYNSFYKGRIQFDSILLRKFASIFLKVLAYNCLIL